MFKQQQFISSIYDVSKIPNEPLPHVILCGRSNVGKSSFINSLFNRRDLAKISSSPGKTRSINFYKIDNLFFMVDLPGYGYAKVSKSEREKWGKLVRDYIFQVKQIILAFHIIDSRHSPTELDMQLSELLESNSINKIVILSKVDKLKQAELSLSLKRISGIFPGLVRNHNLFVYSSVKNTGRKEVLKKITEIFSSR
ncbi:MAG: YihA family ribosome biogenesis GTP-binding protein [Ignavibacteriales bacterium]|nr:YihA family ribosome biogenesis GTP-binding protein [Ignavibacteriales bacterium]